MEIIKVGIRLSDMDYSYAIARALAIESKNIEFKIFSETDDYCKDSFDVVITDNPEGSLKEIFLSGDKQKEIYLQEQPYSVYKYLNSRKLIESLYYVYFKTTGRVIKGFNKRKTRLICGLSDSGGTGITTLLLKVSDMLSEMYGSRCMFFSLCPFNSSVPDMGKAGEGSFMKFLYFLQNKEEFPLGIFINRTENVDFLAVENVNPSYVEMNLDFLKRLLEITDNQEEYEFLIVDMGNHISTENICFLEQCEAVLFLNSLEENPFEKLIHKFTEAELCRIVKGNNDFSLYCFKEQQELKSVISSEYAIEGITEWLGDRVGYERREELL